MRRIRYFFESLHNLYRWFPVIWKDKDYDGYYTLVILRHKIKHVRELTVKNKRFIGWEIEVKWMNIVIILLTNIIDGNYWEDKYDVLPSKNGILKDWLHHYGYTSGHGHDFWEYKAEQLMWKILAWKNSKWWD